MAATFSTADRYVPCVGQWYAVAAFLWRWRDPVAADADFFIRIIPTGESLAACKRHSVPLRCRSGKGTIASKACYAWRFLRPGGATLTPAAYRASNERALHHLTGYCAAYWPLGLRPTPSLRQPAAGRVSS